MANDSQELEKGSQENMQETAEHPAVSDAQNDGSHTQDAASMDTIEGIAAEDDTAGPVGMAPSASSRRSIIKIPRSQRRGLSARFAMIPEVEDPYCYKDSTKWLLTLIIALAAAAAPMGSAIFYPSLPEIAEEFDTTSTITNLSVAMYLLSMGIFPLWWSSFSETLGRRTIYLISFTIFIAFNVALAESTSVAMLIVMRILGGGAAASVQAVGAGTISDIWEVRQRGRAMGNFYLGTLCGPLLAPIIGGGLAQTLGWRSTQWYLEIYGFCCLIIIFFCLPETLDPAKMKPLVPTPEPLQPGEKANEMTRVTTIQSVHIKTKRFAAVLKRFFIDPLSIMAFLRFPAVPLVVYWASIIYGSLYILNISLQETFDSPPYSFTTVIIGCTYIPKSLGYFTASILGGRWNDHIMHREARKANRVDPITGKLIFIPEDRMRENVWIAAALYPAALLWYDWTANYGVHWIVPMIANFFFGLGTMMVFSVATTMLTEFMPKRSSAGVAVNNFVRNIFACVGGIVASPLINALGNGWLFTGLAVICALSGLGILLAMRSWSGKWRKEMDVVLNAQ